MNETAAGLPSRASARIARLTLFIERCEEAELGEILDRLGSAGLGLIIMVLSLVALIPVPGPFGVFSGLGLALVALQIMAGRQSLWLPQWLRKQRVSANTIRTLTAKAQRWMAQAERFLQPRRLKWVTGKLGRMLLGIPVLLLALALAMPIPFGNIMPVLSLFVLALALIERDGLAAMTGVFAACLALGWTAFLIFAGSQLATGAVAWLGWY